MVFILRELIDIIIMTAVTGFIFMEFFKQVAPRINYDPLQHIKKGFDVEAFKIAVLVTAPAIILHEFGHKFVAIAFGHAATFHAAYFWLLLGVALRMMKSSFIFFVPAFVAFSSAALPQERMWIALAGPLVNGALYLISLYVLKTYQLKGRTRVVVSASKSINGFLCIFNMIPIPGFDGFHVFSSLLQMIR